MDKMDLRSLDYAALCNLISDLSEKKFRADQIYSWIHVKLVNNYDEMSNIPKSLKAKLEEKYYLEPLLVEGMQESKIDGTRKYLFKLHDDQLIESVFMKYEHGNSVCVSSQVGCRMGCKFCASTIDGLNRNLTSGEILEQIYAITRDTGEKISNVVIMGSGEPLDNYDEVIRFIRMLTDDKGLNISARNVTLSTCGIVENIDRLSDEELPITLALSLHASNDEKRREIMPIAFKYSLSEVINACKRYYDKTGRRLTFEYSLIGGVNDSDEAANELSKLIKGMNAHVNLIPVNPVKERGFVQPAKEACYAFQRKLEKNHINATIRREMGRDIEGACGQLRRRYLNNKQ